MPKVAKELTAKAIENLAIVKGFHAVGGVSGLHLNVTATGATSWILRARIGSKRRDIGLGAFPGVRLAKARELALDAKQQIKAGKDPVIERQKARDALIAEQNRHKTFRECAALFLTQKEKEFKNAKHAAQWHSTLKTYVYPVIGDRLIDEITVDDVVEVLQPIWDSKTETATRVRGRIESVMAYAMTRKFRSGNNPATWRNNLDSLLPKPNKIKKVEHFAALQPNEITDFWADLSKREGNGAAALRFLILTAARSNEVRGARWEEFDLDAATWTIPAERMKAGREHVVPLSTAALKILKAQPRENDLVFPAPRGGQLSDMTVLQVLRRMGAQSTVHGFRATFKTWATDNTTHANAVVEQALAHSLGALEKAYRRSDLLEKRRELMADWSAFLQDQNVVELRSVK